jgi:hypothetical protein
MDTIFEQFTVWHWLVFGGIFLILELTTCSGFLLWIGIASFLVGGIVYFLPNIIWPWQLLCFSVLSLFSCLLWWRYLKHFNEDNDQPVLNQRASQYIGRTLTLESSIENGRGRVKVGDTLWRVSGEDMPEGTRVEVVSVDGVLLMVKKKVTDED